MADILEFKPKPDKEDRITLEEGDYVRQCDECQCIEFHIGEDMGIYCAGCLELCYQMLFDFELDEEEED